MSLTKEQKEEIRFKINAFNREQEIYFPHELTDKTIELTEQMCEKNLICSTCGFPKNMSREPVFINNDLFDYHEDGKC